MKTNKILLLATCLMACVVSTNVFSQFVDSSFTYQGELLENGAPANGQYDINVDLIDGDLNPWGDTSEHSPVEVVNGLFKINVDFGIAAFDGYKDVTITVSVRKTAAGPGGAFTVLGSQALQAVPLATNLTNGNATTGQVLTFNGFQWVPATPAGGGSSPWTVNGSVISYLNSVGIGLTNPFAALHVKSATGLTSYFDGGSGMYVSFAENGADRGYIGSFVNGPGINDEDFEIGTHGGNSVGNLQFTIQNQPKMTIANNGKVGINTTTPLADLNIDATTDGDVMRVRVGSTTSFYIDDNGGTGVGSWTTPPAKGLRVEGDTKQSINSNGLMKYMVHANCINNASSSITRSYNGVNTSAITVANGASGDVQCTLTFPTDINTRFWQVSPVIAASDRGAHCVIGSSNNKLDCYRYTTSTGVNNGGLIMLLVY